MHRSLGLGGIEAMICGLSNALSKEHDVTVCTIVQPSPDDIFFRELAPAVKQLKVSCLHTGKDYDIRTTSNMYQEYYAELLLASR